MKIVATPATGFVDDAATECLSCPGHQVVNFARFVETASQLLAKGMTAHQRRRQT
jgi:NAD dependent epimerase/dehydratase family enzyme